ncbi:hypothetical protein HYH02_003592 [Chlamydomonas schloesseri]|uniref:HTH myb-type domain-containing protein n=1 Tax=Chlamydomonas schloesseri TaxID=2026947 RepID=A0A835WS23_9CHLO|nr:hypothetical protein HYH02_003592 [Chlamydomonas schloesseri]|eukprot:KAG2451816.1 hypothetical protein HYH02_003592 [Chlamydomonas schloesseri]
MLGTRWSHVAKLIPGRSENCVKNVWYSTCRLKDKDRRASLLYVYAQAVKDCSHDAEARMAALAAAEEQCAAGVGSSGAPTPGACQPQPPSVSAATLTSGHSEGGATPSSPALAYNTAEKEAPTTSAVGEDPQQAVNAAAAARTSISNSDVSSRVVHQQQAGSTNSAFVSPVPTFAIAACGIGSSGAHASTPGVGGYFTAPVMTYNLQQLHQQQVWELAASATYGADAHQSCGGFHGVAGGGAGGAGPDGSAAGHDVPAAELLEVSSVLLTEEAAAACATARGGAPFYTYAHHEHLQSQARRELKWQSCPHPLPHMCVSAGGGGGLDSSDMLLGTLGKELDQLLDDVDDCVMDCEMYDMQHLMMAAGGAATAASAVSGMDTGMHASDAGACTAAGAGLKAQEQRQLEQLLDLTNGMRIHHRTNAVPLPAPQCQQHLRAASQPGPVVGQPQPPAASWSSCQELLEQQQQRRQQQQQQQQQHQNQAVRLLEAGLSSSQILCLLPAVDAGTSAPAAGAATANIFEACASALSPTAHASGVPSASVGPFSTSSVPACLWASSTGTVSGSSAAFVGGARMSHTSSGIYFPSPVTAPLTFPSSAQIVSCNSHLQPITDAACVLGLEEDDLAILMA